MTNETNGGYTHTYKYDLAGNRISALYGGDSSAFTYGYDAMNRQIEIYENGRETYYGYDLNSNLVGKWLPNGDLEEAGYDEMNRKNGEMSVNSSGVTPVRLLLLARSCREPERVPGT